MDTTQFLGLATLLATVSLAFIGIMMAAGGFLPEISETAKRRLPYVIFGVVLVILGTVIIGAFSDAVTAPAVILPLGFIS